MPYLQPNEYVLYGLAADTSGDWVTTASALIDAHCRRPSLTLAEYTENIRLTAGSRTARLSTRPLAYAEGAVSPLVKVRVRYGHPRRGELEDPFRAHAAWAFSLPGSWSEIGSNALDVNLAAGEITLAENLFGMSVNEVEVTYTAGFVTLPEAIKSACAQIVKNAQATPALNVRSSKVDALEMQYFSGSLIDASVQVLLRPYVAEKLG